MQRSQRAVTRAARVHDLGRVAVSPAVWEKSGTLTTDEREQIRLHAYHTERLLASSPFLAGSRVPPPRTTNAATEPATTVASVPGTVTRGPAAGRRRRLPHNDGAPASPARAVTPRRGGGPGAHSRDGRLDAEAVHAVLDAAGQAAPRRVYPAGLTEREVEVLGLLAHGFQNKQIGRRLGISTKTASRHVQNIYPKIGVSTRAAAAVFAMQHGLAG